MVRSARRHRLAVLITRVAALVAMSTPASLVASAAAPDQPGGPGANGTVALIGHQDHGQVEAAAVLEEAGIEKGTKAIINSIANKPTIRSFTPKKSLARIVTGE